MMGPSTNRAFEQEQSALDPKSRSPACPPAERPVTVPVFPSVECANICPAELKWMPIAGGNRRNPMEACMCCSCLAFFVSALVVVIYNIIVARLEEQQWRSINYGH